MRIIAGNSKINILSNEQNNRDFILLAELVDSEMGYEKPILVRNSRDLLIWFGNEFKDYNYLKELLDIDRVCLYLYRGIETEGSGKTINQKYYYIPDITPNTYETLNALREGDENDTSSFIDHCLPDFVAEGILYKVIRPDGINYDSTYGIRYSYYIYDEESDSFTLYDSLDESKNIKSLQNRDRLSVGYYKYEGSDDNIITYSYYHPGMDYVTEKESNLGTVEIENFDKLQKEISEGRATKHLIISGKNLSIDDLKSDPYIQLMESDEGEYTYKLPTLKVNTETGIREDKITYFWRIFGYKPSDLTNISNGVVFPTEEHTSLGYVTLRPEETSTRYVGLATEDFLHEYAYIHVNEYYKLHELPTIDIKYDIFSDRPEFTFYDHFYNVPEKFEIKTDFKADQEDIYKFYVESGEVYRFESKTIGKGSEDIKVEIRWIETYTEKNNIYSITISRYDYQEFYEGPLDDEFGIERLDYKISRESKLVRFKIIPYSEPEGGWPEGEWELKGSYPETEKDLDYSFNYMCKTLEDYPPDFILIPGKDKISSEYRVLDWTKILNCQALITNSSTDWESNIVDKENRLIYFYNSLEINKQENPGYYIFLKGLLYTDSYLPSIEKVTYEFPEDQFNEDDINIKEKIDLLYQNLKQKKSNYLNNNNHYYYYDYYFPGEDYITTPLVRFVISKITRELEKNKWKIIGEKADKINEETVYPILRTIQNRFSIIRSIKINNFVVDGISRTVEASITTTLSDIISSDVSFDIILNYSKLNN